MSGWIGVDLDRTLAHYDKYRGSNHIGAPIPAMVKRVKRWIRQGKEVRIMTARAFDPVAVGAIEAWCKLHIGHRLQVTAEKNYHMHQLWDDRAVQVEPNTGRRMDGKWKRRKRAR